MTAESRAPAALDGLKDSFTLESYRAHLAATQAIYPIVGYEILEDPELEQKSFCLLRHDIDYSPGRARDVARIEAALGVRSTYAVLLTGEYYNPMEAEVRAILLGIAALGHEIGLHFDAAWHRIEDEAALPTALAWEAGILSRLLDDRPVRVFSFHNTTPFVLGCREPHYAGMRNAYAGLLQSRTEYTSDSNGYWIHRRWADLLDARPERIHLLTHPDSWVETEASPAERLCSEIEQRSRATWNRYAHLLAVNGRENRSDIPEAFAILPERLGATGQDLVRRWLSGGRREAVFSLYQQLLGREACAAEAKRLFEEGLPAGPDEDADALRRLFTALASLLDEAAAGRDESAGPP